MCAKGIHDQVSIDTCYWPSVKTRLTLKRTLNGHLDWYLADIELTPRSLDTWKHSIDSWSVVCQVSSNWYVLINTQWCVCLLSTETLFKCQFSVNIIEVSSGFIKGRAPGKLTGCERDLAINLPGCFHLLFLLSFTRKTKSARLKKPTDLLHKNLVKPLGVNEVSPRLCSSNARQPASISGDKKNIPCHPAGQFLF